MPSPPPAKRRKTAAAATSSTTVAAPRRTTRSQRPALSMEMIGQVGSFANYGRDLMNICVAVGPTDARLVKYVCLRNNGNYLRHNLLKGIRPGRFGCITTKSRNALAAWMEINTDWRKLCTAHRIRHYTSALSVDDKGKKRFKCNRGILFNNPAVAIEFGRLDILKHLVEEMGVDVVADCYRWNGYSSTEKYHLLCLADGRCLEYLLSRPGTDVGLPHEPDASLAVWQFGLGSDLWCRDNDFRAIVSHGSFAPNREVRGGRILIRGVPGGGHPLEFAVVACSICAAKEPMKERLPLRMSKLKILLEVGCDPQFRINNYSTLDRVARAISIYGKKSTMGPGKLFSTLLTMLKEKT